MKSINFFIAIFFITSIATAQKTNSPKEDYQNRSRVSPAGASFQNTEVTITWTLGDTLFTLSEDSSNDIPSDIIDLGLSIKAYPNPTYDYLIISKNGKPEESLKIMVFNLNQKKLLSQPMLTRQTEISLRHLPSALYEIKILNSKNQLVKSFKIIKN